MKSKLFQLIFLLFIILNGECAQIQRRIKHHKHQPHSMRHQLHKNHSKNQRLHHVKKSLSKVHLKNQMHKIRSQLQFRAKLFTMRRVLVKLGLRNDLFTLQPEFNNQFELLFVPITKIQNTVDDSQMTLDAKKTLSKQLFEQADRQYKTMQKSYLEIVDKAPAANKQKLQEEWNSMDGSYQKAIFVLNDMLKTDYNIRTIQDILSHYEKSSLKQISSQDLESFVKITGMYQQTNIFQSAPVIEKDEMISIMNNYVGIYQKQMNELQHILLSAFPVSQQKSTQTPNVLSDAEQKQKEYEQAFQKSQLPAFCWNTIKTPDLCPTMFPVRSGFGCFKSCKSEEITVNVFKDNKQQTEKRLAKFERDIAGTCWETCINAKTGQKFEDCEIDLLGKVWTAYSQKSVLSNFYSPYAHFQKFQYDNILNFGLPFQEQIFISNYDERIKCAPHLSKQLKFGIIPACVPKKSRSCLPDFGYQSCLGIGCGQTSIDCTEALTKMAIGTLTAVASTAVKLALPVSAVFIEIIKLVTTILKIGTAIWNLIKAAILSVDTMVTQKQSRPKIHQIQITRAARIIAVKHLSDQKPLSYYVEQMKSYTDQKIASILADEKWQKIKAKFVDTQSTPESITKFNEQQQSLKTQLLNIFSEGKEKFDQIKEQYESVDHIKELYNKAEDSLYFINNGIKAPKEEEISWITQINNYFGLEIDPASQDMLKDIYSKYGQFSNGLGEALSFLNILKSSKDIYSSSDSTDQAHKQVKLFKDLMGFASNFDPTGIAGMIAAFSHDTCLAEEDLTDPVKEIKNEYTAKVKISRIDGKQETKKVLLKLSVSDVINGQSLSKILNFDRQESYKINEPYSSLFKDTLDLLKECQKQYGKCVVFDSIIPGNTKVQRNCENGFELQAPSYNTCSRKTVASLTGNEIFWFESYTFNSAQTETLSIEMIFDDQIDKPQNKQDYVIEPITQGQTISKQFTVNQYQYDLELTRNQLSF